MDELIHRYTQEISDENGTVYEAFAYGQHRPDGTWEGWIEFHPSGGAQPVRRTERETTQPNKEALVYWASGLEAIYLEGALARAK